MQKQLPLIPLFILVCCYALVSFSNADGDDDGRQQWMHQSGDQWLKQIKAFWENWVNRGRQKAADETDDDLIAFQNALTIYQYGESNVNIFIRQILQDKRIFMRRRAWKAVWVFKRCIKAVFNEATTIVEKAGGLLKCVKNAYETPAKPIIIDHLLPEFESGCNQNGSSESGSSQASGSGSGSSQASGSGPGSSQSSASGPESSQASGSGPEISQSSASGPGSSQASGSEPGSSQSSASGPGSSQASGSGPESSQSSASGPGSSQASGSGPGSSQSSASGPGSSQASGSGPGSS